MITAEQARRAIEALAPDERIESVDEGLEALTVVTRVSSYTVRDIEAALNFERGTGYELVDVTSDADIDTLTSAEGFAFLPDGRMFRLNDADELRSFWHEANSAVTPLELCSLLAWYQSEAPTYETLVATEADIDGMLRPSMRSDLSLAIPPEIVDLNGVLMMRWTTLYLTADETSGIYHSNLNLWQARTDEQGDLEWFYTPVARNYPNPFYAP